MDNGEPATTAAEPARYRVEELARRSNVPVRTIREYQTWRLLDPPVREGRVGWYDDAHLERLRLIARLQHRGYSIAGIRDLLSAWSTGSDLRDVLGVAVASQPETVDEIPVVVSEATLRELYPHTADPEALVGELLAAGVLARVGETVVARSPAMLVLVSDAERAGLPRVQALRMARVLIDAMASAADEIAQTVITGIEHGDGDALEPMLRRGRVLLGRAVASHLVDQIGQRLFDRARSDAALRDTLSRLRIGSVPQFGAARRDH